MRAPLVLRIMLPIVLAALALAIAPVAADAGGASTSRSCLTRPARALLARVEAKFGRVTIVSTCRPGARIRGTGRPSRHASGNAIDFHAPKGKKQAIVRWLIASHRSGGTMTYRGMHHIHMDIGHRFVSLGAPSGGKVRARKSASRFAHAKVPRQRSRGRHIVRHEIARRAVDKRQAANRQVASWTKSAVGAYRKPDDDAD